MMNDAGVLFCHWLAGQDPFVQVGLGILFLLIVVPLLLACVAIAVTHLEGLLERWIIAIPALRAKLVAGSNQSKSRGWLPTDTGNLVRSKAPSRRESSRLS